MNIISDNSIKISLLIYFIVVGVIIYLKPTYFYTHTFLMNADF